MTQHSEAAMPADPMNAADPMMIAAYLIDGYGPQQAGEIAALKTELTELEDELARSLVASNPGRTYDQALEWLRGPECVAWLEERGY